MSELSESISSLVEVVVTPLLDYPEDLSIDAIDGEDDLITVELNVNTEDAGKVIGRQGRVIKAIRTLARAAASREGAMVEVELID